MKIYCKYRRFKKTDVSIVYNKCDHEYEIFKEESIEIMKIIGLVTKIGEYQKIYNHVWRKSKSRI